MQRSRGLGQQISRKKQLILCEEGVNITTRTVENFK